jgi:hypothetical protein
MAKLLLIVCVVLAFGLCVFPSAVMAQTAECQEAPPVCRLIRPRPGHVEPRAVERPRPRPPLDDRCRPLKELLEMELQRSGSARGAFQARVAHNAGSRLCREGHPEKGIAEFQRGLSYLQGGPRY